MRHEATEPRGGTCFTEHLLCCLCSTQRREELRPPSGTLALSHCCPLLEPAPCQEEGPEGRGEVGRYQGLGCPAAVLPQAGPRLLLRQPADTAESRLPTPCSRCDASFITRPSRSAHRLVSVSDCGARVGDGDESWQVSHSRPEPRPQAPRTARAHRKTSSAPYRYKGRAQASAICPFVV